VQYEFGWVTIAPAATAAASRSPAGARASLSASGVEHGMTATVYGITGAQLAEKVTWSSSNPAVATIVDSTGMMRDVSDGTTIITATSVVEPRRKGSAPMTITMPPPPLAPGLVINCHAEIAARTVSCGYSDDVALAPSNVQAAHGILSFDMTVQNLLPEAMGTPDGVIVDSAGIPLFFAVTAAAGGTVTANNQSGQREGRPYFGYPQKLGQNEVSASLPWQLAYTDGVTSFDFQVRVEAELQPLLVINEVMVNPNYPASPDERAAEWFEVYNAGRYPVQMQGMVIADSAASGRRPYHLIGASLIVQSGGYVVLGGSANTSTNGGAPVNYATGASISLMNSLDALKISRVYGAGDTLTIDRTQFASAAVSAQNGVSRELKNPALDNSNMDGSNWADASVTAVYGSAGRGTPGAQNSGYTPNRLPAGTGPVRLSRTAGQSPP
jgi:hypothetical protein